MAKLYVLKTLSIFLILFEKVMLNGQAKLRMGEKEIMFHQPPFPLYPGQEQGIFFIYLFSIFHTQFEEIQ